MSQPISVTLKRGGHYTLKLGLQPVTLTSDAVAVNATVIPVLSTVGFPSSGTIYVGSSSALTATAVTYTGKTLVSFTGCSGTPICTFPVLVTSSFNDITGRTYTLTVRPTPQDPSTVITKVATAITIPGGQFSFDLTKADTNIKAATYACDVQQTDVGSELCVADGPFIIGQEVLY